MQSLYRLVGFDPSRHRVRTEMVAGLTTFLTMCYILAVNPDILSATGMDKGALFTATALASAVGTLLIAFVAKLPFAQAPGMGINAFFAFTLVGAMGYTWEQSLTAVFVEGLVFILLTVFNIRQAIVNCIPYNLRFAISAGIGFFIAFVGLKNAGIIVSHPVTFVTLGSFTPAAIVACLGIVLSGVLIKLRVRGALFFSIAFATLIGIPAGVTMLPGDFSPISLPHSLAPTFLKFDFSVLTRIDMWFTIFALVFIDIFNTLGTLIGAAAGTEMMDEKGNVKQMKGAMMADAVATSVGAMLGTSTVTTYVESGAGIAEGGRTGLSALTTSLLFLLALLFSPLFLLVPSAATTGALVLVGVFMLASIKEIDMHDITEALPSFLTVLVMILTYSIAEGMAWGLIVYTLVKLLSGRYKEVTPTLYVISALLMLRYLFM
ncbi:MAG: NCS2 family permease [Bacteroidales bacterium]|nr:NCS2 family permease [Bacteroidales bacterium]